MKIPPPPACTCGKGQHCRHFGFCGICHRWMTLTKNGLLRHHGGPKGSGRTGWDRAYRCEGAGIPPRYFPSEVPEVPR